MRPLDRRRFLALSAAAAAAPRIFAQTSAAQTATLTLHPDKPGPTVPHNFIGLSYETQQLSDPTYFSAANTGLIAQFRALAPHGVLRLGGNTSDYGFWKPTPTSAPPPRKPRENKVGDPPPDMYYGVTPLAVHNLRAFLDATGWTCLYGIGFGNNTAALAADEAKFVTQVLGAKLEYLQVGNEADRFGSTIRDPKTWDANLYFDEWLEFAEAILAVVPNAKFGMPDIASNAKWFDVIAERLLKLGPHTQPCPNAPCPGPISDTFRRRPPIAALSHHYYNGGPPSNPDMTIARILKTDPRVARDAATVAAAGQKVGAPWRMTEGNTCYRGGKPGVSDVFAAALWAADYCLQLASLGYTGVNLHGGDGQMVANSLGGKLPGDEIVIAQHGDPATHPHPYYTPIAHIGDKYLLEPVAYGMMFAQHFAGMQMIAIDFNPGAVNATAYAAHATNGKTLLAVINKDEINDLQLPLDRPQLVARHRLQSSSLTSRSASLDSAAASPALESAASLRVPRSSATLYEILK